jgi:SAM-dependent methyltransferase
VLLEQARRHDHSAKVRWVKGDMRQLPFESQSFQAVTNFFTSFGYFSEDDENQLVLREIARILHEGGQFLLDFLNPDYVRRTLVPYSERSEDDRQIQETRVIVDGFVKKTIVLHEGGDRRTYEESVKLYELADFHRLLEGTGLQIEHVYGNSQGETYDPQHSARMIMLGRKQSESRGDV